MLHKTTPNELDRHDPSGRGLHSSRCARLNCEVLCIVQLCFNAASTESAYSDVISQVMHVVSLLRNCLFSCTQLSSSTPDEVIDLGAAPRPSFLAHMLRRSLKTAISCLTLQTWLVCLLRQKTRRVLLIALALVAASQQARLPLNQRTTLVKPQLSSELSGWSALGVASPLAHRRFG